MHDFILKEVINSDIEAELEKIGFDKTYTSKAKNKFIYKNIKLYGLSLAQANIIKQSALSVGADCGCHRELITGKVEKMDCLLGGSISQLRKIADKLKYQPFGLKGLGEKIEQFLGALHISKTKIAGILNLTENSFSDGGQYYEYEHAVEHLLEMIADGADIIDIGAESTKPYSAPVTAEKQLEKILPVMDFISQNEIKVPVSIDTRSSVAAEECIKRGAKYINDVSGLDYDKNMTDIIAKYGVKVIIQHSKGTPETMQQSPHYESLTDDIYTDLKERIDFALSRGIRKENIIVDPGIGFGKTRENNFEIIRRIEEFYGLGCPVMAGVSRKSLLDMDDADNHAKDLYTLALNALLISRGIDFIRVHNVKIHKKLLNMPSI